MKYVPVEKLIAMLRRQKHELELSIQSQGDYGQSCQIIAYENILSLIDSLQQEQPIPDFEKEIEEYFGENWKEGTPIEVQDDMIKFARDFWNKGYNARKEE